MPTRNDRAGYAEEALFAYRVAAVREKGEISSDIIDLVTDLLHYTNCNGVDPYMILSVAEDHFEAEDAEE